jgi:hypothetical protein
MRLKDYAACNFWVWSKKKSVLHAQNTLFLHPAVSSAGLYRNLCVGIYMLTGVPGIAAFRKMTAGGI